MGEAQRFLDLGSPGLGGKMTRLRYLVVFGGVMLKFIVIMAILSSIPEINILLAMALWLLGEFGLVVVTLEAEDDHSS